MEEKKKGVSEEKTKEVIIKKKGGFFGKVKAFLIGILCGILILTGISAYATGLGIIDTFKALFSREAAVEEHDMTISNNGVLGYTAADFAEAILGEEKELRKLEVYSREVSDVVTITRAGLFKIKAFSKYQYITYNGTATYTVDLSKLNEDSISLDEENKTVVVKVPAVTLEPINIPSENIQFGDVKKNTILAFGDIKLKPEDQAKVETEAKNNMMKKLEEEAAADDAKKAAEYALWELFQPVVSDVSAEYTLKIEFVE